MMPDHTPLTPPDYFDVHSHINDAAFDVDRIETINRTLQARVWTIVVGTDRRSSQLSSQLALFYEGLYAAAGIHPTDNTSEHFWKEYFIDLFASKKTVAVGECGLDYFRADGASLEEVARQKTLFESQLELAVEVGRPLMIHCRNAHDDMLDILASKKREYGDRLWGNIHFFTAGESIARRYLELDFTLSFSGVITFAREYDDAIRFAPQDMILSETDSPYAAPVPYRGKRNEPLFVKEVVKQLALVRGEDFEEVRRATVENAIRVFLALPHNASISTE